MLAPNKKKHTNTAAAAAATTTATREAEHIWRRLLKNRNQREKHPARKAGHAHDMYVAPWRWARYATVSATSDTSTSSSLTYMPLLSLDLILAVSLKTDFLARPHTPTHTFFSASFPARVPSGGDLGLHGGQPLHLRRRHLAAVFRAAAAHRCTHRRRRCRLRRGPPVTRRRLAQ
jgi:hypothetical protein